MGERIPRPRVYNPPVQIILYLFSGLFIVLALGLAFSYLRRRHRGLLLMAAAYGGAAGAAIALNQGWPLLAGLVVAWLIRLAGLDPDVTER